MSADRGLGGRLTGFILASAVVAFAAIIFLPWAAWLGTIRRDEWLAQQSVMWGWLAWTAVLVPAAILIGLPGGRVIDAYCDRGLRGVLGVPPRRFVAGVCALAALAAALLCGVLFARNPHLVDTIGQLFQARIFAGGSLAAPAPQLMEHFAASQLVQRGELWFSQYPPGHPAILAVGVAAGVPWLMNPLFAGGTAGLIYAAGRRAIGEGAARLAALLYVLSPFVLFMSASYMNHVTTGFFLAASLYATTRSLEEDGYRFAVLTGISLALAMTIRPLESAAWAVVLGSWILWRRGLKPAAATAVVCLIALVPLFAYNAMTVGHPLRLGYTLLWGAEHGLGFHTDPWGEPFTPLISFANTALDFARLNDYLFGWPVPSLLFLLAALVVGAKQPTQRRAIVPLLLLLLAAPVAYFFYWHRDDYLGPRFLFASLVPVLMLTAVGVANVDRMVGRFRPAYRLALLAVVFVGLARNLPERAGVISGLEPEMKLHPEEQLAAIGINDGVVFVKVGWGSRLIGRLWGWEVPASEVERSYRVVDGCRILGALNAADSAAAAGVDSAAVRGALRARLGEWRQEELPVASDRLPDASVRVDTTRPLDPQCEREVAADHTPYTLYETLVWRNDPWLERGNIYARFLDTDRNVRLLERYPGRPAFLYAPLTRERSEAPALLRLEFENPAEADSANLPEEPSG